MDLIGSTGEGETQTTALATTKVTELRFGAKSDFVRRCLARNITKPAEIKERARKELGEDVEISDNTIHVEKKKLGKGLADAKAARRGRKPKVAENTNQAAPVTPAPKVKVVTAPAPVSDLKSVFKGAILDAIWKQGKPATVEALNAAVREIEAEFKAMAATAPAKVA